MNDSSSTSHRDNLGQRLVDKQHPWLGLSPFSDATYQYFFGRDTEIQDLFKRVRDNPLTILYGQSGLGKTSLVGAGLVPKLRVTNYSPIVLRLRFEKDDVSLIDQVNEGIERVLSEDTVAGASNLLRGETLWESLQENETREAIADKPPVVIFDQFEEIFTLGVQRGREAQVAELIQQIADLVKNSPPESLTARFRKDRPLARKFDFSQSPVRFLISQREDFLSHLEEFSDVMPAMMRNRMALHKLTGPQALEAVVRPGRLSLESLISDEVGAQVVRFVAKKEPNVPLTEIQAVPPLVSLVCDELNNLRLERGLTEITESLVTEQSDDILNTFYEQSFAGTPAALRQLVEDRMLTQSGNRYPVPKDDAIHFLSKNGVTDPAACLAKLVKRRLIHAEERGSVQWYEITHDVLTPLAVASRDERQERVRNQLATEKARKARRQIAAIALALGCLTLLMGAGWFWAAGEARAKAALTNKAERKEAEAKKNAKAAKENEDRANRKVSEAIDAKKQTQRILAKSFTKEGTIAFENWDLPRALLFLVSAGVSDEQPIINRMLHKTISRIETHSGSWLAHTSEISSISTSSTGKFIVTTDIAGGVRLWDENTLELAYSLDKQTAESTAICFDQSDKICIVGSLSGELWYYQLLEDGDYDATNLRFHFDRINSISVTNKEQILVASSDRHVSVWEKKSRKLVDKRPHENPVVAAYWLPDGGVASFAKNGNLHLGDLGQKPKIIDLSTNINFVIKTGDEFLVVGTRGGIHLLDNQGNVLDQARPYRSNSIVGVNDWNANLQTVVFSDQSGRVYRAQVRSEKSSGKTYLETKEISIPTQQADPSITGLALNDDRELHIAYANGEMLTRLLHEESIRLKISTHDELSSVASSRGKVFTGNTEGSISIYQPPDQWPHETTLLGKDVRVNEMAISPDHKYAAIAATSGNVFLVRLADRQFTELNHSPEEESWVNSVLFTTDSKQLITADHQSLAVWDIASKQQTKSFNPDLSQLKQETQPYSKPPLIKDVVWSEVDKSVFILHRTGDIYRRGDTENRPATTGWHEIDIVDQTVLRKAPHFISGNGQKLIHSPNSKLMAIKRHQKIQIVRVNSGDYSSNQAATVVDAANQQTLIAVGDLKGRISLTNTGSDFDTSWTASDKPIEFLKFLLSKSGQELIFTADQDGVGKLWDRENLVAVYNPPENKAGRITAVSGSEDGSVIVIGRSNGSIEIFQTDSGVRIARFSPHRESITSVLIAGELIVGASKDGNFFTSNIAGVNSADAMTKFLSYPFQYEALSSDEKRAWENVFANSKKQQKSQLLMLAAKPNESPSKLAALLVKETGEFLTKGPGLFVQSIINRLKGVDQVVLTNHRTEARAALSSDEATVCTYSEDGIIEFWKNDNSKLQNLNSHDLGYVIWEAKFSDDGSFLVTRGFNSELAIFASDGRRLPDLMGHRGRIGRISWEKGSRRLISGSRDQTARIWDLGSKSAASTVLKGHTDYVTSVALSKNRAVTGAQNGELWLWNIKNAKCMQRLEESDGVKDWAPVRGMTISRDKKAVFTGHENGTLRKWELVSGSLLLQCKLNSKGQVIELARDVEQSHKASKETETKNLVLLKTEELESEFKKIETKISTVDKSPKEETLPIEGVSLRSKSDEIVVIFRGGSVVLTFADSDFTSPLQTMGHDTELFGDTSISGDGNTLTTASKTGEEYVWRLDTGGLVAKSFVHDKFKLPGALSVDGQTLVSGGENGSVFVSDVAKMHRPKGYFKPLPSFDRGLVSSNSKTVVYLAEDRVRFAQRQEDSAKVKTHSFQDFEANGSVVDAVISADGNHASIFESGRVVFYSLDDRAWQQKAEHNFVSLNVSDGKVFSYTELEEDEELIELQLNEDFTLVDPKRVEFIKGEESGKSKSWLILTRQKVLVRATVQEDKTIELNFLGSEVQDAAIAENGTLAWIDDQGIHCGQKFAEPVWSDQKFSATRLVWSRDSDQLIAADESGDFIFFKPSNGKVIWNGYGHDSEVEDVIKSDDQNFVLTIDELGDAVLHDFQKRRPLAKIRQFAAPFVDAVFDETSNRFFLLNSKGGLELAAFENDKVRRVTMRHNQDKTVKRVHLNHSEKKVVMVSRNGAVFEVEFEDQLAADQEIKKVQP